MAREKGGNEDLVKTPGKNPTWRAERLNLYKMSPSQGLDLPTEVYKLTRPLFALISHMPIASECGVFMFWWLSGLLLSCLLPQRQPITTGLL